MVVYAAGAFLLMYLTLEADLRWFAALVLWGVVCSITSFLFLRCTQCRSPLRWRRIGGEGSRLWLPRGWMPRVCPICGTPVV